MPSITARQQATLDIETVGQLPDKDAHKVQMVVELDMDLQGVPLVTLWDTPHTLHKQGPNQDVLSINAGHLWRRIGSAQLQIVVKLYTNAHAVPLVSDEYSKASAQPRAAKPSPPTIAIGMDSAHAT